MIVVRNVFRMKFGVARDAVALFQEGIALTRSIGFGSGAPRLLTDLVGPFYTLVLEHTFESLAEWERSAPVMNQPEWKAWYAKVVPVMESGYREVFTVVA